VAIGEVAGSKREDFALSTTRQESAPKLLSLAMAQHGSPCQKSADICRNALLVVMASRLCATGRATPSRPPSIRLTHSITRHSLTMYKVTSEKGRTHAESA
jgi:hypothetical protein